MMMLRRILPVVLGAAILMALPSAASARGHSRYYSPPCYGSYYSGGYGYYGCPRYGSGYGHRFFVPHRHFHHHFHHGFHHFHHR